MRPLSQVNMAIALILALSGIGATSVAQAGDFLSDLFGALAGGQRPAAMPSISSPFPGSSDDEARPVPLRRSAGGEGAAYCVRGCDGRYFPAPVTEGESRAAVCASFCPASETRVVYGSSIDTAATETGQAYSDLPNAFRYRNEMVKGCTCNGRDALGLAPIRIEDDRTLRKGDIVAGPNGLVVATGRVDKRSDANVTPASAAIRARFARLPVVARE